MHPPQCILTFKHNNMSINNSFATSASSGKYLGSIDFEINDKLTSAVFRQNYTSAIIGTLQIGQSEFRLNSDEIDHLISTLQRAKEVAYKKYTMNLL